MWYYDQTIWGCYDLNKLFAYKNYIYQIIYGILHLICIINSLIAVDLNKVCCFFSLDSAVYTQYFNDDISSRKLGHKLKILETKNH